MHAGAESGAGDADGGRVMHVHAAGPRSRVFSLHPALRATHDKPIPGEIRYAGKPARCGRARGAASRSRARPHSQSESHSRRRRPGDSRAADARRRRRRDGRDVERRDGRDVERRGAAQASAAPHGCPPAALPGDTALDPVSSLMSQLTHAPRPRATAVGVPPPLHVSTLRNPSRKPVHHSRRWRAPAVKSHGRSRGLT